MFSFNTREMMDVKRKLGRLALEARFGKPGPKPRLIALTRQHGKVPMAIAVREGANVGTPFEVSESQWREIAEGK